MKELENQQPTSPMTKKSSGLYTSFVRRTSSMTHKLLPKNPESVIAVLKHVWDQEYIDVEKKPLMDRYWKRNNELGEMFLEIGKGRAHKNETKLSVLVNKLKSKYNSLRQACHLGEISWMKFHRHISISQKKTIQKNVQ